jgi:hypothetical protein
VIELAEGVWIDPWSVTMIKKIDDGKCALWTTGQSALEGFILDYSAEQVAEVVNDARNECEEEEDE